MDEYIPQLTLTPDLSAQAQPEVKKKEDLITKAQAAPEAGPDLSALSPAEQPVPYALPLPKTARRGVGRQGVSLFACREISGVLCCRRRYCTDPPHFVRQKKLSKRPGRSNVIKLPQGHTGMPLRFCYFSAS